VIAEGDPDLVTDDPDPRTGVRIEMRRAGTVALDAINKIFIDMFHVSAIWICYYALLHDFI